MQMTLNSLALSLDEIEEGIKKELKISMPEDLPKSLKARAEHLANFLMGIESRCALELLPKMLLLLQDPETYATIMQLLLHLIKNNSQETLEIIAKGTEIVNIKTQCLDILKLLLENCKTANSHRVIQNLAGVINDPDRQVAQTARELIRKMRDSIFRATVPKDEDPEALVFSIIPKALVSEFESTGNKKTKLLMLKSIEDIIINLSDITCLIPYQQDLIEMVYGTLVDSTKEIVASGLKILIKISAADEINLGRVNGVLRSRLGDSSINIRQNCFRLLLRNLKHSKELAKELLAGLESDNWHVREETVNLFIAGMLKGLDFSHVDVCIHLVKLLDDEKSKVRQVAVEALAVIAHVKGKDYLQSKIAPLLDELALKMIENRLEFPSIASLNNDLVSFPRLVPSTAPIISSGRTFFSPIKTSTEEFTSTQSNLSPVPRSTSLTKKKTEDGNIFAQRSEFVKPPLPLNKKKLPKLVRSPKAKGTIFDKIYPDWATLTPLEFPNEDINVFNNWTEDNWEIQFDFVNKFRSILKYHKNLLNPSIFHKILIELLKWGDSLRSSLSKVSLLALGECFKEIPKQIDADVDPILNLLLKKSVDTNSFILETANEALVFCVSNCSLSRLIQSVLVSISQAKSGMIKSRICVCCKHVTYN